MTPEQRAAQEALQQAVEQMHKAYPRVDSDPHEPPVVTDWLVSDWALVIAATAFDGEGDMHDSYFMAFADGAIPAYRAKGLFKQGLDMLLVGKQQEEEDD